MGKNYLITGGAGFIGSNYARRLLEDGNNVFVFDNLSRKGAEANLDWIGEDWDFFFKKGDVRDFDGCQKRGR